MSTDILLNLIKKYEANNLDGNMLKVFFLSTRNQTIRKLVLDLIDSKAVDGDFWNAVGNLYSSKEVPAKNKESDSTFLTPSGLRDENIRLFSGFETDAFSKTMGLIFFDMKFSIIPTPGKQGEPSGFFAIGGGNTSALRVDFQEYDENEDGFVQIAQAEKNEHRNWVKREIKPTGILASSGIDKMYVGMGYSKEGGSDSVVKGDFSVYFYKKSIGKGFLLRYELNCSSGNNNYKSIDVYFQRLAYALNWVWIN